jgi:hypothetical protein
MKSKEGHSSNWIAKIEKSFFGKNTIIARDCPKCLIIMLYIYTLNKQI